MVIDDDGVSLVKQFATLKSVYKPEPQFTFDNSREGRDKTSRRIARQILLGDILRSA